jgi:hypothetical protein
MGKNRRKKERNINIKMKTKYIPTSYPIFLASFLTFVLLLACLKVDTAVFAKTSGFSLRPTASLPILHTPPLLPVLPAPLPPPQPGQPAPSLGREPEFTTSAPPYRLNWGTRPPGPRNSLPGCSSHHPSPPPPPPSSPPGPGSPLQYCRGLDTPLPGPGSPLQYCRGLDTPHPGPGSPLHYCRGLDTPNPRPGSTMDNTKISVSTQKNRS